MISVGVVEPAADARAVVADGGVGLAGDRDLVGEPAAEAVAHHADGAGADLRDAPQVLEGRQQVGGGGEVVDLLAPPRHRRERRLQPGVVVVVGDAALGAPEHVGAQHDVAEPGEVARLGPEEAPTPKISCSSRMPGPVPDVGHEQPPVVGGRRRRC